MPTFTNTIPLSLYIHLPWCVRKCPYCDFNSHEARGALPEALYVEALLHELELRLPLIENRPLISLFFGGGTPSLFSAQAIGKILDGVAARTQLTTHAEITLEANPGTVEQDRFRDFRAAGVNRLSLGIQSLQDDKLAALGRIHDKNQAIGAVTAAQRAGFDNVNLDLMYGLPKQTINDALSDLQTAAALAPTHISWYQLTIEPNTVFYKKPPVLPTDDHLWDMHMTGQAYLNDHRYMAYEVSAYAQANRQCTHNLNYWEFGDYLGIGAGAHSKITDTTSSTILRFAQTRQPRDYLEAAKRAALKTQTIPETDIIFEFMLNALRLTQGFNTALFTQRTGLPLNLLTSTLDHACARGLLTYDTQRVQPTALGQRFLNDLTAMFLSS